MRCDLKNAKKHHLAFHIHVDYLMILKDINELNQENQKLITKDKSLPNNIKKTTNVILIQIKAVYMLFYKNFSSPVAVCELDYFQSYTCISSVYVDSDKRGKKLVPVLYKI